MSKLGKRLIASAKEGRVIARGEAKAGTYRIHVPADIDVADLRHRLGLSQSEFAQRFGFNVASIRDWEQGRATPTGPIRAYLKVIKKEPKAVQRALTAA